jgi:hypothetical protein
MKSKSSESTPGPWAGERRLFWILLAGLALWWLALPEAFHLPNNDYYSFERAARSFAAFELPADFKRTPPLPALMALVAPLIPGPQAYLGAARLLNAGFSLGLLALLFGFGARTLGRGALMPVLLLVFNAPFQSMGLQPLVEPSMGFFVLLTFYLFARRSRWQYAAAAAAALSRYEVGVIIPAIVLANLLWDAHVDAERPTGRTDADDDRPTGRTDANTERPTGLIERLWNRTALRHIGLGALACLPVLIWGLLGARFGQGDSAYLALMSAAGFKPQPRFFESSIKQPFEGWFRGWDDQLHWFLLAVGLPLALGIRAGWRDFRQATVALLVFYVAAVLLVVGFGIDKARYVYPSQWIAIFFVALGLRELALDWLPAQLRKRPPALAALVLAAATAVGLRMGWIWWGKLARTQSDVSLGMELAFLGLGLALLLVTSYRLVSAGGTGGTGSRRARSARSEPVLGSAKSGADSGSAKGGTVLERAPDGPDGDRTPGPRSSALARSLPALAGTALVAALALPLMAGSATLTRFELNKVRYDNWDIWLLAEWVQAELPEGERIVMMHPSHLKFLTGLPDERVSAFADFEAPADDFAAFTAEMRARGIRYAAYTYRTPPKDRTADFYYQSNKLALAEVFAAGQPLPGFEHLASLPLPAWLEHGDVQIYRLEP